jgi:hypothetical protein
MPLRSSREHHSHILKNVGMMLPAVTMPPLAAEGWAAYHGVRQMLVPDARDGAGPDR